MKLKAIHEKSGIKMQNVPLKLSKAKCYVDCKSWGDV